MRTVYWCLTPQVGRRCHRHGGQGRAEREVSSHTGGELKLGHTQVIFPTVQDDAGLRGTSGYVGKLGAGEVRGLQDLRMKEC